MKQKTIFKTIFTCATLCLISPSTAFADTEQANPEQLIAEQTISEFTETQQENSDSLPSTLRAPEKRGPRGPRGVPGQTGPQGPRGHRGKKGHKGDTGDQGPAGTAGAQGEQGIPGTPGEAGPAGTPGTPGTPGAKGDTGDQGIPGEAGPAGEQGSAGEMGPIGLPGTPGAAGTPGAKGDTGDQGPAGPTGATGAITENAISFYTSNSNSGCELDCNSCGSYYQSGATLNPGQTAINFSSENMRLGNSGNIQVNGTDIWVWVNGTYLISVSGIVQEPTLEGNYTDLSFTIGLQEEQGEAGPCSLVNPFPLAQYGIESPNEGGFILYQTFSVLQMVRVSNAGGQPVIFRVLLNNISGNAVSLLNPVFNMIQID